MGNPAFVNDIEERWVPLSAQLTINAQSLLDDAWAILKNRVPDLEDRILAGTQDPQLVIAVECSMVLRVLKNPDGKRQEAVDDYSWTRDSALSAGAMYVTPEELRLITDIGTSTRSKRLVAYGDYS